MAGKMPLSLPRGNGVMKQIAQETFGHSHQTQVGFTNENGSSQSGCSVGQTRDTEMVVWILIVLLAVVAVAALYLLWHKAGGTTSPI
jgi:hypothetical protein